MELVLVLQHASSPQAAMRTKSELALSTRSLTAATLSRFLRPWFTNWRIISRDSETGSHAWVPGGDDRHVRSEEHSVVIESVMKDVPDDMKSTCT